MRPLKVFVSGPLTDPTISGVIENVWQAEYVAARIIEAGHYPFVPHQSWTLDHQFAALTGERKPHAWWIEWCIAWLDHCDALYRIGPSPGADMERDYAVARGIPVVETVDELELLR